MTPRPRIPGHSSWLVEALAHTSEIQVRKRKIFDGPTNLTGRGLLNLQIPLSFLLAAFPMLFVCSDMTRWRLETGQGGEGFGIHTTHCPPHPHKALSSSAVSGALGSDCWLPGARETLFCLLSHPNCPQFVLGVADDRGCFEMNLSPSSPPFLPSTP